MVTLYNCLVHDTVKDPIIYQAHIWNPELLEQLYPIQWTNEETKTRNDDTDHQHLQWLQVKCALSMENNIIAMD